MRPHAMVLLVVAACAAAHDPEVDGGEIGAHEVTCCDLIPDQDAVRSCVVSSPNAPPPGTCGVIACRRESGGFDHINFCIP